MLVATDIAGGTVLNQAEHCWGKTYKSQTGTAPVVEGSPVVSLYRQRPVPRCRGPLTVLTSQRCVKGRREVRRTPGLISLKRIPKGYRGVSQGGSPMTKAQKTRGYEG